MSIRLRASSVLRRVVAGGPRPRQMDPVVHRGQRNWPTQPAPLPLVHAARSANDMVLQRDVADPIWGWSTPGDKITVAVDGKPSGRTAVAGKDGRWMTKIGPFPAGGPHTLTVPGGRKGRDHHQRAGRRRLALPRPVEHELAGAAVQRTPKRRSSRRTTRQIRSFTVGFLPSLVP